MSTIAAGSKERTLPHSCRGRRRARRHRALHPQAHRRRPSARRQGRRPRRADPEGRPRGPASASAGDAQRRAPL